MIRYGIRSVGIFLIYLIAIVLYGEEAVADNRFECSSSIFTSYDLEYNGKEWVLDDVMYPGFSQKRNSAGWLWAKIRTAEIQGKSLLLLEETRNLDSGYTSKYTYFILNMDTLEFSAGEEKTKNLMKAAEALAQWFRKHSGRCKRN